MKIIFIDISYCNEIDFKISLSWWFPTLYKFVEDVSAKKSIYLSISIAWCKIQALSQNKGWRNEIECTVYHTLDLSTLALFVLFCTKCIFKYSVAITFPPLRATENNGGLISSRRWRYKYTATLKILYFWIK